MTHEIKENKNIVEETPQPIELFKIWASLWPVWISEDGYDPESLLQVCSVPLEIFTIFCTKRRRIFPYPFSEIDTNIQFINYSDQTLVLPKR